MADSERLDELHRRLTELWRHLDLAAKEKRIAELDALMARPDFWDDPEAAARLGKERERLTAEVEAWKRLEAQLEDCRVAWELGEEEGDEELVREAQEQLEAVARGVREMELRTMLGGPHDPGDAIVAINAGAGGTEAQDWAQMLLRMYLRWAEKHGFEVEIVDELPGEEAGVKNVTFTVSGPYAYGYLKAEEGVHRLVRISPFDAQARRHTSFASVSVYPEAEEDVAVEIDEKDLRVDVFRASGAGGQHVNRTESAVRITHLPTGIVVTCQSERSQHKNRSNAMRVLKARLLDLERRKREEELEAQMSEKREIAWGSQIRSYILQPYRKIKDHRTGLEEGDVDRVLDGDLDPFMEAYLLRAAGAAEPAANGAASP
ncbi:peptide chain release factor 2 [Deferrisoma camini]|uniref:peptide chain release factor 2 n=1 Tax=Deferrisoma camini TaxID=1035120 RepID=UPI001B8B4E85